MSTCKEDLTVPSGDFIRDAINAKLYKDALAFEKNLAYLCEAYFKQFSDPSNWSHQSFLPSSMSKDFGVGAMYFTPSTTDDKRTVLEINVNFSGEGRELRNYFESELQKHAADLQGRLEKLPAKIHVRRVFHMRSAYSMQSKLTIQTVLSTTPPEEDL